jgi:hypothetical protein
MSARPCRGRRPADSLATAWYAARAAQLFQSTHSRAEAQIALPYLVAYYGVLRRTGGEEFDVANAARWELDWWQLRRENVGAKQYGLIIAQNTSAIFHVDGPDILTAGLLRADAMQYRDEHGRGDMRERDWAFIQEELARSYQALHAAINPLKTPAFESSTCAMTRGDQ